MSGPEVLDVSRDAIFVMLKMATPLMIIALVVGLVIAFVQALTQIQEMTLSFVPKILALFLCLILFLPFIGQTMQAFSHQIFELISRVGA